MRARDRSAAVAVSANMRRLRREHGWTQEQLGEKLGDWTKVAVSAAERSVDGKRVRAFTIDEVVQIAGVFGVSLDEMVTPIPPCATCGDNPPAGMQCLKCGARGDNGYAEGR